MTELGVTVRDQDEDENGAVREPGAGQGSGGGPLWWTRRRAMVFDITLGVVSAVECGFEGLGFASRTGVPEVLAVVLASLVGALLALRRRWPVLVVLVAIAVTPAEIGFLLSMVGLYSLAASDLPRRIIGALAGMMFAGTVIITWVRTHETAAQNGDFPPPAWSVPLVSLVMSVGLSAPPLLLGLYAGARRRLVESLRERADGMERELSLLADRAEERAEWARREERTRIAREMHDVVAHRVSLMVVHAAALQAVAPKDPDKASRNAALVGDMGRQALTELRTMLGVLRTADGGVPGAVAEAATGASAADAGASRRHPPASGRRRGETAEGAEGRATEDGEPEAGGAEDGEPDDGREVGVEGGQARTGGTGGTGGEGPETAGGGRPGARRGSGGATTHTTTHTTSEPFPSLGELDGLVGQSRQAGMTVDLLVEGEHREYASQIEQTAYRVVQEALTNVHKHAAGAPTRVRLAHRGGEVALQVENEPPAHDVVDAGLPSGGNGLVGMRERVVALGGVFVSGPTEAGGFRVSAVIPEDAAA